jgi:hypothetical protein
VIGPLPVTEADILAAAKRPFRRQRARASSTILFVHHGHVWHGNMTHVLVRVANCAHSIVSQTLVMLIECIR